VGLSLGTTTNEKLKDFTSSDWHLFTFLNIQDRQVHSLEIFKPVKLEMIISRGSYNLITKLSTFLIQFGILIANTGPCLPAAMSSLRRLVQNKWSIQSNKSK
jgi:hypothetical protein